jgi:hypothetical protein
MKKFYYSDGITKNGPFTFEELKKKEINPKTLIWYEGLKDWMIASEMEEMKPILELIPPPVKSSKKEENTQNLSDKSEIIEDDITEVFDEEKNDKNINTFEPENQLKEASNGWIIAGFIFSLLGGYLGVIIGFRYAFGNYKRETKTLGWIMAIIGIFSAGIWRSI